MKNTYVLFYVYKDIFDDRFNRVWRVRWAAKSVWLDLFHALVASGGLTFERRTWAREVRDLSLLVAIGANGEGYRRVHVLLSREGWKVNAKQVYRLYVEEGLSIRAKTSRRRRASRYRTGQPEITGPNEVWAMDFMLDALFDGRPF